MIWHNFDNGERAHITGLAFDTLKYHVVTTPSPWAGGTVTGAGTYVDGASVTVSATPSNGYQFVNWTSGTEIVSTSSTYTFTVATKNQEVVAHFIKLGSGITAHDDDHATGPFWRSGAANDVDGDKKYGTDGYYLVNQQSLPSYIKNIQSHACTTMFGAQFQDPVTRMFKNFDSGYCPESLSVDIARATDQPFRLTLIFGAYAADDEQTIILDAGDEGNVQTIHSGLSIGSVSHKSFDIGTGTNDIKVIVDNNRDTAYLTGMAFDHQTQAPVQYQVNVSASPIAGGTATGGGTYVKETVLTVLAAANSGYQFVNWTEAGIEVSHSATYSFTVSSSRELVAHFTPQSSVVYLPGLRRQIYTEISGANVADLTASPKYPNAPDIVDTVAVLESQYLPGDVAEHYGQRLTGWLVPPLTGTYVFYLAADDGAQVFLSTDDSPYNKQFTVQETTWTPYRYWEGSDQHGPRTSAGISLVAQNHYYLEVLHKEGEGGDNVALAWQLPGGAAPKNGDPPIGGEFLVHVQDMPEIIWSVEPPGSGTVNLNPAPPAGGRYTNGTVVTLTAVAATDYRFSGWTGALSGMANPASLTINGTPMVTAHFVMQLNDVTQPGDPITATSGNSPGNEGVNNAIDNNVNTKYLNFDKLNTGFTVTPSVGPTIVSGVGLTSANDVPDRDPASYRLEGSLDGKVFTLISAGSAPTFASRFEQQNLFFSNTTVYRTYRLIFPTVDNSATDSMQIGEVQLFGIVAPLTPPRLGAAYAAGTLTLSWDASATGYTLEKATSLQPPVSWTAVSGVANNRVTVSAQEGTCFYRLRLP